MLGQGNKLTNALSIIIAERRTFITDYLLYPNFEKECKDHLFPELRDIDTDFRRLDVRSV
jgi:hypothetical protein